MKTVILKWNPAISSYQMVKYLQELKEMVVEEVSYDCDWSVWDYDKIHAGDRCYLVKLGVGQVGVVSSGVITSEPYLDDNWNGTDNKIYWIDYIPDVIINPDTLPILTSEKIAQVIPDFDWFKGHSGMVLDDKQAKAFDELWQTYLSESKELFGNTLLAQKDDQLYLDLDFEKATYNYLTEDLTEENTLTLKVGKKDYLDAFFMRNFSFELTDENYKQVIKHVDGVPTIVAQNPPKKNYGIHWYNKGDFPYILRDGLKYLKLEYEHQCMVSKIDMEEIVYSFDYRYSQKAHDEEHPCCNGSCCHWHINMLYIDVYSKEFEKGILPTKQ